jgi:N-acetylglucosamine-6-phosphate deacetylase
MPGIITSPSSTTITKFTNCRLVRGDNLVKEDLWVSSSTGTILSSQATFFDGRTLPDQVIDLGGRIVSPGLLDVQLNGAFGFNFSTSLDEDSEYKSSIENVNVNLVKTGVTSYMPTITSQKPELYKKVLHIQQSINEANDILKLIGFAFPSPNSE